MKLLPTPTHVIWNAGSFRLPNPLPIQGEGPASEILSERLLSAAGVRTVPGEGGVRFVTDPSLPREGYRLSVTEQGVSIASSCDDGARWAVQTVLQLLPVHVYSHGPMEPADLVLPAVEISDEPRFAWRGSMVDVARNFLPMDGLLRHLEVMAAHKLNVLHIHFTDDQGWRLPIQAYPKLTEVGAWRPGTIPGHQPPWEGRPNDDVAEHDGVPHGGFYTRDEIDALVRRASQLGITIVPEVDMPGHMESVLAAYPELGACQHVQHPRTAFGISHHVLNLSAESVKFCTDVLDEVMEMFPGSPIHIGGDECPAEEWMSDPVTQATMRGNGLTTGAEAQAWFERQICQHLLAAGRRPVGWDEVLEMGAPEGVTIMVWRSVEDVKAAARQGFDVIAAPVRHTYFDYAEAVSDAEPLTIGAPRTLADAAGLVNVLHVEPEVQHHVLGGQFQLWSEYVRSWPRAEYLMWPRGCCIAQQLWAGEAAESGTYEGLQHHLRRLTAMNVNWRRQAE